MTARSELSTLEASGLVRLAAVQPELEYLFRHALVQDAAYSSLLKQDRRRLHGLAAEALLALYPERRRELAGVIAMHFEQAGDPARAAEYYVIAGEHAGERYANREAVSFFERAEALRTADAHELALRAVIGSVKAGWTFTGHGSAIDRLELVLASANDSTDQRLLADAYFWLAFLRARRGETATTSPRLRDALANAERIGTALGDPTAWAIQNAFVGAMTAFNGQLRTGANILEPALASLENKGDPLSTAMLTDFLAMTYARLGDFDAAERALAQAERFAAKGDPIAQLDSLIARSNISLERGDLAGTATLATQCSASAEELGATACAVASNLVLGSARLALDDVPGARPPIERSYELSVLTNQLSARAIAEAMLGTIKAQLGDAAAGAAGWEQSLEMARANGDRFTEAMTLWLRAYTAARRTPPEWMAALADLDASVALFDAMEAQPSVARVLRARARALRALGRDADADADERRSREIGRRIGLTDFAEQ